MEAISICEKNNNSIHLISCLISLGDCSLKQNKYEQAILSYSKAEELLHKSIDYERKSEIAISLGYCYEKLGNEKLFNKYKDKVFRINTEMKWGK